MNKDINLHSFNGPHDSARTVDWSDRDLSPGPEISDTVKCSTGLRNFRGRFGAVTGGREDCVDVNNHCWDLELWAELWAPKGKYLATIKGGSGRVTLGGDVVGHGSEVDIDIGNISDQSTDTTGPVSLNLRHLDGDAIRVRVINGSRPVILNPDEQKYVLMLRVPPFFGTLFARSVKFLRRFGLA